MSGSISSARRNDDQLLAMMDQTADWTVNGRAGCVLGASHSLRDALQAVFRFEDASHHVFAVCRQPGDAIIVFREQIQRIAAADRMTVQPVRRDEAA
jgi:hypothetical protein